MLLTITYTGQNAIDLGYLLYKNPYRPQVNHGKAYVFYPQVSDERTTAALCCWTLTRLIWRGAKWGPVTADYSIIDAVC